MANKIILKKSAVTGKVPLSTDLDYGELALNYADGKIYYKGADNLVRPFSSSTGSLFVYGRSANTIITLTSGVLSVTGRSGSVAVTL